MTSIKKVLFVVVCLLASATASADMFGDLANIVGAVAPQYRQAVQQVAPVVRQYQPQQPVYQPQQPVYQPQQPVYQQQQPVYQQQQPVYQQPQYHQESRYENHNGGYDPN